MELKRLEEKTWRKINRCIDLELLEAIDDLNGFAFKVLGRCPQQDSPLGKSYTGMSELYISLVSEFMNFLKLSAEEFEVDENETENP